MVGRNAARSLNGKVGPAKDEAMYYDRQRRVPGWGAEGQKRLADASVLVVGVGGLGCPALTYLARSGVGRLGFADPDRVETSNLPRQTLFSLSDGGRLKVEVAAEVLRRANPWIVLEPRPFRVDASNVRLVENYDLILDGTDNFTSKFVLHDACFTAGKPFIVASLYQWEAQVQVFDFRKKDQGCWRCLYPEAPVDGCVGVCADVGVAGALAGLAGSFQALAALRLLLDLPTPKPLSSWVVDAEDWTPRVLRWKKDPSCSLCSHEKSWDWLEHAAAESQDINATDGLDGVLEKSWDAIADHERQVVVDLREPDEIRPEEWEFFASSGSRVLGFPWSGWRRVQPDWQPDTNYLLVCAGGFRSLAALRSATPPSSVRLLSLRGGVAGLNLV